MFLLEREANREKDVYYIFDIFVTVFEAKSLDNLLYYLLNSEAYMRFYLTLL